MYESLRTVPVHKEVSYSHAFVLVKWQLYLTNDVSGLDAEETFTDYSELI
jgi:hypothetical protein